ncbi:MAG TPA: NAD(P)/FAD-dependent oxidoreductase [Kribbella sp.]|uniref:NAD(P)/FAD-dependent oxidoreductase n=1 Tax=Kribbella sp. TaxID=1871183 RepID=UPI002D793108|nr:NAD(P)/FAD-dependent oxidoreductase [Kribbella sp.]HET6297491.1 NAD(P)/FAD-dependent oxidoreductase [Kribbella sp.]
MNPRSRAGAGWDAIVVGGRVAGASTALLLARSGLRVLVVDRARRGSDTVSTHALMRGGVLQLRRWGLLDRIVATGTPPVRRATFHYGAESMPISLKPYAGVDALYAPRRTVLDALLVDAAEEAGARFRFGLAVTDLARDSAGRVVGVVLRDHDGATWTERARQVVGADGRGSVVAGRVAAPTIASGSRAGAYVYGYWPAADVDGYHWYYGDALSAGVIPTNDGLACVFVGGPQDVLASAMRDHGPVAAHRGLLARLDEGLAERTAAPPYGSVRFFRGMPARLRRPYGPGWALVGDAGCWVDPLSTHGITDALRDAELLAIAIVAGSASERAEGIALVDYQAQRDRMALPMQPIVDRLASHEWDLAEARRLLHGLSSVMADEVEAIRGFDLAATRTA